MDLDSCLLMEIIAETLMFGTFKIPPPITGTNINFAV